jgi:hypothetical protein
MLSYGPMADVKLVGKQKEFLNWSKREPKEAALKVFDMVAKFERHIGWRHQMAWRGAQAYSGAGLGDLFENLSFDGPWNSQGTRRGQRRGRGKLGSWNRSREQHARAIVKTVVEKLFGMDEPKCQLVATDAEWEVRRQGIWADRFVEGNYHLQQGSYLDFWDLARQAALLAFCATGAVAIRTEPDFVSKRVRNQLRSTLNTFIDPADRANGVPLTLIDVTWENPEYMCEDPRFQGKEDKIWAAAKVPEHLTQGMYDGATFGTPMVKQVTAWRLPFGSFKGKHAIFIGGDGEGGEPLHWDNWKTAEWPLSFFRCDRCIGDDFWGENMIEIALSPLRDAEDIDDMAQRTMDRTSQTYMHLDGGSSPPAALLNAKDVNVCRYDSKKGEKKVEIDKPGILNSDYWEYRDRKIQLAHDLTGVSLMHQSGEIQGSSGQRSGRSIRLEASLLPERFARTLRGWRNFVAVDCARNHIRAARLIGEEVPDWQVTWPGADFDAKVSVEVLNIDLEQFTIRPYAVSEQKNTPADRADAAQEMFDRGEINAPQLTVILEGLYDTKKETKASTAERRYVSKVADEMLHGDEKLVGDENRYMSESYIPPMPWIDPDAAMAQASPIYLDALIDGVPQNRRALLRRFMEDIWALRMQKQREVAMQDASVNVAATADQAFPLGGAPPGGPLATPPGLPPTMSPALGAPVGAPMAPPGPALGPGPALNAPGAPGLV